jgi:hypothetical protein
MSAQAVVVAVGFDAIAPDPTVSPIRGTDVRFKDDGYYNFADKWCSELERRIDGQRAATAAKSSAEIGRVISKALRQALSLQQVAKSKDTVAAGVVPALNSILSKLQAAGFDLHDIEVVIKAQAMRRAA